MTPDEVRERIAKIRGIAADDEGAHFEQDKLYVDVLRAIANGHDAPQLVASLALEVDDIDFARWYA